jgi:hypothetical protein
MGMVSGENDTVIVRHVCLLLFFIANSESFSNTHSKTRSGQSKDRKIGICCFSAKHAALRRKSKDWLARNQDKLLVLQMGMVSGENDTVIVRHVCLLLFFIANSESFHIYHSVNKLLVNEMTMIKKKEQGLVGSESG